MKYSELVGIKKNIKLLAELFPEVKRNYNTLIVYYWREFDLNKDPEKCTPAESITRAFRDLVAKKEIVLDKDMRAVRAEKEQEYKETFTGGDIAHG